MATARRFLPPLFLAASLALLPGCGKRGQLIPPEALVPAPIATLAAAQKGGELQVSWSGPGKQEKGGKLEDLAGFLLYRRDVLPPAQDCEECPNAYKQLALVDLDLPQGVRQVGSLWIYDDFDLKKGQTYQYKVRSFTKSGAQSKDSNKVRRTAVTPPLPPVLEAAGSPNEVTLSFVGLPPEQGTAAGYNVYRGKKGEPMPLAPLNKAPLAGNTYQDREVILGITYSYAVTSVAAIDSQNVESAPSNVVEAGLVLPD
ncbi:fibronectin type III domain-containing protein [Geomonas nitrogeniifigens]|uniref:Fibronectin type III domain-containing protein n=1 Tax=Geomonas diazotrophica TaxID=2843197 RepID=A0ABX8JI79_9BACT|nr:fibronectin type III domain-containing protein [Geomonas nitrogeniifigens]QWV96967.1 fibronectin type III domain-containing protein [Geomonas nitrogeniifigens]QXE86144.1 fibronectin type III domain-containing protein [Geomonas nitrogeniifigens]